MLWNPENNQAIGMLMRYRASGHEQADLNPLEPRVKEHWGEDGWGEGQVCNPRIFGGATLSLKELEERLEAIYCGSWTLESRHMSDPQQREWLYAQMELCPEEISPQERVGLFEALAQSEALEAFLHTRYVGQKRFSLEGLESFVSGLKLLIEGAVAEGTLTELVMGMAHRGRLNVLTAIFQYPLEALLKSFEPSLQPLGKGGDVKYHKGWVHEGRPRLLLCDNPSHLASVYPVVLGRARGRQQLLKKNLSQNPWSVLPLVVHGDAAFMGQGLVAETLNLFNLHAHHVGGALHIVLNNHIGFTANPDETRSTRYCTDVAKIIEAPIFHVNAQDPVAVLKALRLALRFRNQFFKDAVVELSGYRKHGHNESDEPRFTHPQLYDRIKTQKSCAQKLEEVLEAQGFLEKNALEARKEAFFKKGQDILDRLRAEAPKAPAQAPLPPASPSYAFRLGPPSAVPGPRLRLLAQNLLRLPEGFVANPKIVRQLEQKTQRMATGMLLDWSLVESLAWASLLDEGVCVRLCGQDSCRGTFSQRHAVMYDMQTGKAHCPLKTQWPHDATFEVYNSTLSEAAVLGFEYGHALEARKTLCLWEAQFGDFVNGAQVIVDQYLSSGEVKWGAQCGLVLLLPHGYEGQGPEHSSAHIERFLQACADDNWQVAQPSTPAQYFHLLRRQAQRSIAKPLILFTPKSLLRHPQAVSSLQDLDIGVFESVLEDPAPPEDPDTLILCSGKVYYDLLEARAALPHSKHLLLRLEQYYPLDVRSLRLALHAHSSVKHFCYCQEEPENRGAWAFLRPQLEALLPSTAAGPWRACSRPPCASPATGSAAQHALELKQLLGSALQ